MAPQVIPAGLLVTVPAPAPAFVIVSTKVGVKVGVTTVAAVSVTAQAPVPLQPPPLQPVKTDPAAGTAVSVTTVPLTKVAEQFVPQVIPDGVLVTVPEPLPALTTASANPDAIVKVEAFEVPPPGAGLTTVT